MLILRRNHLGPRNKLWEFPGGKQENGEDELTCIKREVMEEINLKISSAEFFDYIEKEYEDRSVNELGIPGETAQRFRGNSDCQNAYVFLQQIHSNNQKHNQIKRTDTKTSSAGQTFRDATRRERA